MFKILGYIVEYKVSNLYVCKYLQQDPRPANSLSQDPGRKEDIEGASISLG